MSTRIIYRGGLLDGKVVHTSHRSNPTWTPMYRDSSGRPVLLPGSTRKQGMYRRQGNTYRWQRADR